MTTSEVGTIGYIPSEVIANPKLRSPRQDVYACGIMLYEGLASRQPDPNNYQPLAEVKKEYSVIDPIITKAIAKDSQRMNSAKAFADHLTEILFYSSAPGIGYELNGSGIRTDTLRAFKQLQETEGVFRINDVSKKLKKEYEHEFGQVIVVLQEMMREGLLSWKIGPDSYDPYQFIHLKKIL